MTPDQIDLIISNVLDETQSIKLLDSDNDESNSTNDQNINLNDDDKNIHLDKELTDIKTIEAPQKVETKMAELSETSEITQTAIKNTLTQIF